MIDRAQAEMAEGSAIALELISGVNDNMSKSHFHEYYEIYFLDSGRRNHVTNNQILEMQSGDCIIFPPLNMHHSYGETDVPFSRVCIYFRPDMILSSEVLEKIPENPVVFRPDEKSLRNFRRKVYEMLTEGGNRGPFRETELQALLNQILVAILRMQKAASGANGTRMARILNYISGHYAQDLSLSDMADIFGISEYYFCREFRKYTNRSFIEYLQITRVMNAKRLFMETDMNVTQVAMQTGFSNLTHFNRVFRSISGETPSSYRRKCRQLEKETAKITDALAQFHPDSGR